jgi:hypothetical protein
VCACLKRLPVSLCLPSTLCAIFVSWAKKHGSIELLTIDYTYRRGVAMVGRLDIILGASWGIMGYHGESTGRDVIENLSTVDIISDAV